MGGLGPRVSLIYLNIFFIYYPGMAVQQNVEKPRNGSELCFFLS